MISPRNRPASAVGLPRGRWGACVRTVGAGAASGFTIIELGVVMAIMAVIATVVLPSFMELTKNDMARQAADQVQIVQDAARAFYLSSVRDPDREIFDPTMAVWPGEQYPNQCQNLPGKSPITELFRYDMLEPNKLGPERLVNQWGQPLRTILLPVQEAQFSGTAVARTLCSLVVSTDVPKAAITTLDPQGEGLANVVRTYLPGATCGGACTSLPGMGSPGGQYIRCCSLIPKPGLVVSMQRSMVEERIRGWRPPP